MARSERDILRARFKRGMSLTFEEQARVTGKNEREFRQLKKHQTRKSNRQRPIPVEE